MNYIIIDTNFLIKYPKILGSQIPDSIVILPEKIFEEIKYIASHGDYYTRTTFSELIDLIVKSINLSIVIAEDGEEYYAKFLERVTSPWLNNTESFIASIALGYKSENKNVKIATQDKKFQKFITSLGIEFLSKEESDNLLNQKQNITTTELQEKIENYEYKENKNTFVSLLVGILVAFVTIIIYNNLNPTLGKIFSAINVWGTIIVVILAGISLFIFREKRRLSYGVFEFIVGIIAIVSLFYPNNFDYSKITFDLDFNVKLLGGLYIMVRGQDNIVTSVKRKKLGIWLKERFGIGEN
jgi:rRNA maturation endonuclease Nob1